MKKVLLFLLFCLCCFFVFGQQKIEKELEVFSDSMKARIQARINPPGLKKYYTKNIKDSNLIVIPYCKFMWEQVLSIRNIFDLIYFAKDSGDVKYQMWFLRDKDSLIVIPRRSFWGSILDTMLHEDDDLSTNEFYHYYLQAKKISKCVFVLRISPGFADYKNVVVAYIDENRLKVLASPTIHSSENAIGKKYDSIQDFIIDRFGSLEEYYGSVKSQFE